MKTRNTLPIFPTTKIVPIVQGAPASACFSVWTFRAGSALGRPVNRRERCTPFAALVAALLVAGPPATLHAQLVADGGTTNITTGINLPGNLIVGTNAGNTTLNIIAPGAVTNAFGFIGFNNILSVSNVVSVRNTNAVWRNTGDLHIGTNSAFNSLVISNGGSLYSANAFLGFTASGSNNQVTVTGPGSLWRDSSDITVGYGGSGNLLAISNGAVVANNLYVGRNGGSGNELILSAGTLVTANGSFIGQMNTSSNNLAIVTGAGSFWTNNFLSLGIEGGGNQLVVSNAGTVAALSLTVGLVSSSLNDQLTVDGGTLLVSGYFEVRRGASVFNAGLIEAGNLLISSGAGSFEFNGGTLAATNISVNNGVPFLVGNGVSAATNQLLGNTVHMFGAGLIVTNNARLTGNGTINGTLTVTPGGTVAPGNSPGQLILNASPVFNGALLMEISKPDASTFTNDQIQVTFPLTYGGSLTVTHLGPTALASGDVASLFNATSYDGAFTSISLPALGPGLMWTNRLLIDGSLAVVPQTPPAISGATQSGTNLVFNVIGGSPGGAFTVLTSTNVALPRSNWSTNSTGNFDWLGNVTVTNAIDPATSQGYFTIRVP